MPTSWSHAVADADSSDATARYRRALQQVEDLQPLVQSFIQAVKDSGKWPLTWDPERPSAREPDLLATGDVFHPTHRYFMAFFDGTWTVADFITGGRLPDTLVTVSPGTTPVFAREPVAELFCTNPLFDKYTDAMEILKDWLPRELVAYLRGHQIPVPVD